MHYWILFGIFLLYRKRWMSLTGWKEKCYAPIIFNFWLYRLHYEYIELLLSIFLSRICCIYDYMLHSRLNASFIITCFIYDYVLHSRLNNMRYARQYDSFTTMLNLIMLDICFIHYHILHSWPCFNWSLLHLWLYMIHSMITIHSYIVINERCI